MIDIKQQVKEYLLKENISLTDVVNTMNINRPENERTTVQNINNKLTRGTIKYSEILDIAEIIGYNIIWQKLDTINQNTFLQPNINYPTQSGINYQNLKQSPRNVAIDQLVQKFFSNVIDILNKNSYLFIDKQKFESDLVIAKMNLYSFPLQSFIYMHGEFLNNSLFYIQGIDNYISTLTYIRNIYIRGGINILDENTKIDLINLLEYLDVQKD